MAHRSIGQERFGFAGRARSASSLDELGKLIDWEAGIGRSCFALFGQQRRAGLAAAGDVQGTSFIDLVRPVRREAGRGA